MFFSDVVRFDNTYSWMKAKTVSYLIEVVAPEAAEEIELMESTYL